MRKQVDTSCCVPQAADGTNRPLQIMSEKSPKYETFNFQAKTIVMFLSACLKTRRAAANPLSSRVSRAQTLLDDQTSDANVQRG
eukprot:612120-Hanusia_phi.AAC.4